MPNAPIFLYLAYSEKIKERKGIEGNRTKSSREEEDLLKNRKSKKSNFE
jgi:hypothetical protein